MESMIRVNLGRDVLGNELEEALIYAANKMEFSHSVRDWDREEYMLNPVRKEKVYGGSKLELKGLCSHFRIDFNRGELSNSFLFEDVIAQTSEVDINVAAVMLEEMPEKAESPEGYIQDYLSYVSAKLYENV